MIAETIDDFHYELASEVKQDNLNSDDKADTLLYVLSREREAISEINAQAELQITKIKDWAAREIKKHDSKIDNLTQRLNSYFDYLMINDKNLKTKSLPNGTMKLRKQQPLVTIEDESLFLAQDDGKLTRHVPGYLAPDKAKIKKYIKDTGDIPAGVVVETRNPKFTIDTGD